MKNWTYGLAAAMAAALAPSATLAAGSTVALDAYYVIPEFELDIQGLGEATFDEGDGLGVKGRFELTPQVFVAGEYQSNSYDEVEGEPIDTEIKLIRGGAGFRLGPGSPFYALGEVINVEIDIEGEKDDETGYGVHLGAAAPMSSGIDLYGQVGYVDVEADGFEFLIGIAMMVSPQIGLFADYRNTSLEDDDTEDELTLSDVRVGLRILLQ